jgi:hypothetical protein
MASHRLEGDTCTAPGERQPTMGIGGDDAPALAKKATVSLLSPAHAFFKGVIGSLDDFFCAAA